MYLFETLISSDTKFLKVFLILFLLSCTMANVSFALPADTIKVVARHPEAEAASLYQINFRVAKTISPQAVIQVRFPSEFDLSDLSIAGSSTINGGFELEVKNQLLILTRSGLGREITPNEKVDVKFAIVKNPAKANENYSIEIEIFNDKKESILKKQETIKQQEK